MQGTPAWYSGPNGVLKGLYERAWSESTNPYVPYYGNRTEPFNDLQNQAFNQSNLEANTPQYESYFSRASNNLDTARNNAVGNLVQPYINASVQNPTINAQQYMNPYNTEVIQNIGKLGSRNLMENILPNIQDKFISGGQYGSTGHQNFTNRAIRDTQEAIAREQSNALQSGYNKALDTSTLQQERNLQAGTLAGKSTELDMQRKLQAAQQLAGLAETSQNTRLKSIGNLSSMGSQQQQLGQEKLNTAYGDFQDYQKHPYNQTSRVSNIVQGHSFPQSSFDSYMPKAPSPGGLSSGAGLLGSLYGAYMQPRYAQGGRVKFDDGGVVEDDRNNSLDYGTPYPSDMVPPGMSHSQSQMPSQGLLSGMYASGQQIPTYAHGGRVSHIRHYADGGAVPTNPIQKGANDAFDTAELHRQRRSASTPPASPMQQQPTNPAFNSQDGYYSPEEFEGISDLRELAQHMKRPQVNPLGAALMKAGLAYAGRKEIAPGFSDLANAANIGLDEYQTQAANQEKRRIKAADISRIVGDTHRQMAQQKREHEFKKLEHTDNMKIREGELGVHRGELGVHEESLSLAQQKARREQEEYELGKGYMKINKNEHLIRKNPVSGEWEAPTISGLTDETVIDPKEKLAKKKEFSERFKDLDKTIRDSKEIIKIGEPLIDVNQRMGTSAIVSGAAQIPIIGETLAGSLRAAGRPFGLSAATKDAARMKTGISQLLTKQIQANEGDQRMNVFLEKIMADSKAGQFYPPETNDEILKDFTVNPAKEKLFKAEIEKAALLAYQNDRVLTMPEISHGANEWLDGLKESKKTKSTSIYPSLKDFLEDKKQEKLRGENTLDTSIDKIKNLSDEKDDNPEKYTREQLRMIAEG